MRWCVFQSPFVRSIIAIALVLSLGGFFTSDEPKYPLDSSTAVPLLPDNGHIFFKGVTGIASFSGWIKRKNGTRAVYEAEKFDDILLHKLRKGGIIAQFRRKSDGRTLYLCFTAYEGHPGKYADVKEGYHTKFAYRIFDDPISKKKFTLKRKAGHYDLRSLGWFGYDPCSQGQIHSAKLRKPKFFGDRDYAAGYVLDLDTEEGVALKAGFEKNIEVCGRIVCDVETKEEKWARQLRPEIRNAALADGCLLGSASYRAAQAAAKGNHPFEVRYDPESGCRFLGLGIVQYRLDVGAIDASACRSGECTVYYAINCTAGSGIGYEACSKSRHLRGDLKAIVMIRNGEAELLRIE